MTGDLHDPIEEIKRLLRRIEAMDEAYGFEVQEKPLPSGRQSPRQVGTNAGRSQCKSERKG